MGLLRFYKKIRRDKRTVDFSLIRLFESECKGSVAVTPGFPCMVYNVGHSLR